MAGEYYNIGFNKALESAGLAKTADSDYSMSFRLGQLKKRLEKNRQRFTIPQIVGRSGPFPRYNTGYLYTDRRRGRIYIPYSNELPNNIKVRRPASSGSSTSPGTNAFNRAVNKLLQSPRALSSR